MRYAWYYRLLNGLLRGLAHLPLPVLYVVADALYLLLAYVLPYRRAVVLDNLRHAFPDKLEADVRRIGRQFYRHFTQVLVEILRLRAMPAAELRGRLRFTNPEVLTDLFAEHRQVLSLGSHLGNWEWILAAAALQWPGRAAGVYKRLSNPFFEDFARTLRTRLGADAVPMPATLRYLVQRRGEGHTLSLLLDQAAGPADRPYWTDFMHREAGFYTSADRLGQQLGAVAVYVSIRRERRGHYAVTFRPLPAAAAPGEYPITEAFVRELEADLRATPADYLWTHRRWKHVR